ncbi:MULTISPECIES: hypothetical protein [Clostridia]|uniref:hypothetical protein n=1 Tax=Clostridia TaxID=186801 RepID=UPI0005E1BA74|nr:hypothetical protein [Paeniclostridium sordellii]MDU2687214.1 hypothetical protein [Paeniclostridium sordellii]CEO30642.1 phosphoglucomutase PgcA [[Clostridium] sordellii] [Paeniclostridium sordellii]
MKKHLDCINNPYFNEETKQELLNTKDNHKDIEDRFYNGLAFVKTGLREVIAAVTDRKNTPEYNGYRVYWEGVA